MVCSMMALSFRGLSGWILGAPVYVVDVLENVILLIWRSQPSLEGAAALRRAFESLAQRSQGQGKIAFVTVIEEAAIKNSPEAEIRQAIAKILRDYSKQIGAATIICEVTGLRAAMIRVIISAIALMSGTSFPYEVATSVPDGLHWLAQTMGPACRLSTARILEMVQQRRPARVAKNPSAWDS